MNPNFRHSCKIEIRFSDMDAMGHVNNAVHFTYLEQARIHYFKAVISENIDWSEIGIILAHSEIDYKVPIVLDDNLIIYTKISRLGTKSFEVIYSMVNRLPDKEIELATGKTVLVCFNYKKNSSIEMPEKWKKAVHDYEGIS